MLIPSKNHPQFFYQKLNDFFFTYPFHFETFISQHDTKQTAIKFCQIINHKNFKLRLYQDKIFFAINNGLTFPNLKILYIPEVLGA